MTPSWSLRAAAALDWDAIVTLNNTEVPKVGPLTRELGSWFLDHSDVTVVDDGVVIGLLVLLADGSEYSSPNYRWFAERYPSFTYVDRIVVDTAHAGSGIGRALYTHALAQARESGTALLTAEVNVDPPNERSLAFHRAYGFEEVSRFRDPRYDDLTVAMFALDPHVRR